MIEMGIETQMMRVERKLRRNAKMMITTSTEPDITASVTELIDWRMKNELSLVTVSLTPGTSRLIRSISSLTRSATATVFWPDCLVTRICTPGLPLTRTKLRKSSVVSRSVAMSRM